MVSNNKDKEPLKENIQDPELKKEDAREDEEVEEAPQERQQATVASIGVISSPSNIKRSARIATGGAVPRHYLAPRTSYPSHYNPYRNLIYDRQLKGPPRIDELQELIEKLVEFITTIAEGVIHHRYWHPLDDGGAVRGSREEPLWAQTLGRRGPWPGRATRGLGAPRPFASFFAHSFVPKPKPRRILTKGSRLRGGEHQREKSSPAGRIRREIPPEGEIDAIAIVIERTSSPSSSHIAKLRRGARSLRSGTPPDGELEEIFTAITANASPSTSHVSPSMYCDPLYLWVIIPLTGTPPGLPRPTPSGATPWDPAPLTASSAGAYGGGGDGSWTPAPPRIWPRIPSDVAATLTAFFAFVSTQFGRPIHALQTDNGKEFDNITIRSLLATHGAIFRLTCPYTSSQNGRAERMLRTLNDCVRTLLFHASMPPRFWPDALATATLLVNIRPCRVRWFYTPHHLLYGAPPTYDDLRIFGCRCYPNTAATAAHKLAPRSLLVCSSATPPTPRATAVTTRSPIVSSLPGTCTLTSWFFRFSRDSWRPTTPRRRWPPAAARRRPTAVAPRARLGLVPSPSPTPRR
ncbi:hypothetical protein QYE76_000053 [Lolium multiflorum]|uniref:Integrase catalytic domain-containing protein n=1 Tax=Lolium multiflorum TaxID=4521 RepID=A0AAD8V217_LOLMU|nr:hypothetical protein QYE76_000053 [Lolium multiflorum]